MSQKDLVLKAKKKQSTTKTVKPGHYVLRYDSAELDENYADRVVHLTYTLFSRSGTEYRFEERFIEKFGFERTNDYYEYLNSHGIETLDVLPGMFELIKIAWKFGNSGKRLPSIIERQFITEEEFNTRSVLKDA